MGNLVLSLAALSGFIAVAFGAFASHALQADFSAQQIAWVDTGWKYQVFHTLALFALGLYYSLAKQGEMSKCRKTAVKFTALFWTLGIVAFSFSLYVMAVLNTKAIAMIVPIGGVAFLAGWAVLLGVSIRSAKTR